MRWIVVAGTPRRRRTEAALLVGARIARVRRSLRRLLESDGYTVLDAASAPEARAVLEREGERIDVVILDHSMPNETGVEAMPSFRARSRAKIILFSGMAPDDRGGVDAVISKPARSDELERVLRRVLSQQA